MKKDNFIIEYKGEHLEVEHKILNKEIIYRVALLNGSKINLTLTSDTFSTWAEGNGYVSERSLEIGEVIEEKQM